MSDNSFTSNINKGLLWDMMLSNNMFTGIDDANFNNVRIMFDNVIQSHGQNIKGEITREELLKLNKTAILEIKNNLDIFKRNSNENSLTPVNIGKPSSNEKILIFDKNLQTIKDDFENSISIKKPKEPEFLSSTDVPYTSDNMNYLVEKLQAERNQLILPPPSHKQENSNLENSNLEDNKKSTVQEKITDINQLLNIDKHVSFLDEKTSNNNTKNSIKNEKLDSIFNLLKEIDEKHKKILELLNF